MTSEKPKRTRRKKFNPPQTDIFDKYKGKRLRSNRAIAFIEGECKVPSGRNTGKPYRLLPFQKELLREALDNDNLTVIWSLPRGAGKTGLAAPLLVYFLFESEGSQVLACSTSMRTARLAYDRAVRIIEGSERLAEQCIVHYNAANPYVDQPHRGSQMFPLPAEEKHIVGMSPSVVLIDEVGYVTNETFEAMQTSLGKVEGSLLLGIGTPGLGITEADGQTNLMWRLRQMVQSDSPPESIAYIEYAADKQDDPAEPATWKRANPGVGILVDPKAIALDYATMPLARFQQMRLGLWSQHEAAWLPVEDLDALRIESGPVRPGSTIAIGFDGSASGDATAIVIEELASGRITVAGLWERPKGDKKWKVPRGEVMAQIDKLFRDYNVVALLADPWYWRSELEQLEAVYGDRIVSYNTASAQRMAPAADAFREDVRSGSVIWDGNQALREHLLSAVAKRTAGGDVLIKDARRPQHIDLAVAAVLAHEAARLYEPAPVPVIY